MAKILIQGERATAEIVDIEPDPAEEAWYVYQCEHGHEDTARGDLADTMQAGEIHVDFQCPGPNSSERETA